MRCSGILDIIYVLSLFSKETAMGVTEYDPIYICDESKTLDPLS